MFDEFYAENCLREFENSIKSDDLVLEFGVTNFYTTMPDLTFLESLERQYKLLALM